MDAVLWKVPYKKSVNTYLQQFFPPHILAALYNIYLGGIIVPATEYRYLSSSRLEQAQ